MAPRSPTGNPASPSSPGLGRSGLDLLDLLATTDLVTTREATGTVAREVGLEQARGTLLRNHPGEALALLDGIWEGARRSEEGWYLRSAALSVLGLPVESDRVAGEGLAKWPSSLALRFFQSVARLAVGDVAGAKTVLQPALLRAPAEPVLQAQHALVQARQGDARGAEATLTRLERAWPDHPAVEWGRGALGTIVADATRQRSRTTPTDWPSAMVDSAPDGSRSAPVEGGTPGHAGVGHAGVGQAGVGQVGVGQPGEEPMDAELLEAASTALGQEGLSPDVATSALERFGARVATRPLPEVAREARVLLRAFSAGGTLATATRPEQAHAARVVMTTLLGVATRELADVPQPVRTMVEQLVPLLREGRVDDADRVVRRQSAMAREPIGRLLLAVVRGAALANPLPATVAPVAGEHPDEPVADPRVVVQGDAVIHDREERASVVPARLGLALLEETPATRAAFDARPVVWNGVTTPTAGRDALAGIVSDSSGRPIGNVEIDGRGWGAARQAGDLAIFSSGSDETGMRAVAIAFVVIATVAMATGHGVIAIGLAAGAAWMGLRGGGDPSPQARGEGDGAETRDRTHERSVSQ